MRDLFETFPIDDPIVAARRGMRTPLRQRFFEKAEAAAAGGKYSVTLDGKPVRTPARRLLAAPRMTLAQAIADEWRAQREVIDPVTMPLTRLANVIVDGVAGATRQVAAEIEKYLASDLLFYRAETPLELRERQAVHWDPILRWAKSSLNADFVLGSGIVHVAQPKAAVAAAVAAIPAEPWRLGALHAVTTLTGSALIALALSGGGIDADAAWTAAHVDEDWNMERWGRDEMALERRANRFAEFSAAVVVLRELGPAIAQNG